MGSFASPEQSKGGCWVNEGICGQEGMMNRRRFEGVGRSYIRIGF
jgi:hypothetical protein